MTKELKEKLKKIRAVVFDGDGVLFTGRVMVGTKRGEVLKERSYVDGQGTSFLRAIGIKIALVSGEKTGFVEVVGEKLNSLPSVKSGKWSRIGIFTGFQSGQKVEIVEKWLEEIGVKWEECAAMGDDIADYQLLRKVGFAVAPAQAETVIKNMVHYVTPRVGGYGAIRDFCNLILEINKIDPTSLNLR